MEDQTYYDTANYSEWDYNLSYPMLVPVPLVRQPIHMIVIYSIAYGLVFILAMIGNILVIAVIYKDPSMRNVTNYFILNMAVADILVAAFCLPITLLANIFTGWRFGEFMCKSTPYIQSVVQCASVNTLAAIAFDRYLAICYSRHSKITACTSRTTIIIIWVFSSTIMIPLAVFYELYPHDRFDVHMCHQLWPDFQLQRIYFLFALFILCYLLPLIMILICYLLIANRVWKRNAPGIANGRLIIYKSKVKVLKMLAVIVLLFAFSWLPLYTVYLRLLYGETSEKQTKVIFDIILPISQWLGSSNCSVNPVIYCFFSKKYRRGFRNILYCRFSNFAFRRHSRTRGSLSTRYVNVDNSSGAQCLDPKQENQHLSRLSSNKYMVVAFCNGKMTVSFRKDNADKDDSSF